MGPYGFVLSGGQICFEIQRPLSGSRLNMLVLIAGLSRVPGRPELIDEHLWIYPTVRICEHTQNKRTLVTFLLPHKQSNMHDYLRHESSFLNQKIYSLFKRPETSSHAKLCDEFVNHLRAKLFRGNINIYLHFMLLLHIDMTHVLKILPQVRPGPTYST